MPQFPEEKIERKLQLLRRKEEEDSVEMLSQKYGIPYADLSKFPVEIDALKLIPEEGARRGGLSVFQKTGKRLNIAVRNPQKEETRAFLKRLEEEGYTYDLYLVSGSGLEYAYKFYRKVPAAHKSESGSIQISEERLADFEKEITDFAEVVRLIEERRASRATEALEVILAGGLALDVSDIHIEPQAETVRIRFRMDGVLRDITFISRKLYTLLLSRIKLVAEIKLNIRDRAQDGRFTIKTKGVDTEVRVSTLPGPDGENIALRLLNPKIIQIAFEELGMQPPVREIMERELKKPNGMILTTGPTGSGKTTTLYAFLQRIHAPSIKIITIEDPIEYHLSGIEQTQVNTERGYDFSNGLRSIVRQDPDVILVGEIRDLETAETAMHASLTGHLVFSTLHTNDAAGIIPRLIDLGVKPNIIAPAINVALAQRLVRRLCPSCRAPAKLDAEERQKIVLELNTFPPQIPAPPEKEWKLFIASAKGCPSCHGQGYKGRAGIFELILIDAEIERMILREPSEFEIKKAASAQGQITMKQDGLLKTLAGITDFAELERVIGA